MVVEAVCSCWEKANSKETGRDTQEGEIPVGWEGALARHQCTQVSAGSAAGLTAAYELI